MVIFTALVVCRILDVGTRVWNFVKSRIEMVGLMEAVEGGGAFGAPTKLKYFSLLIALSLSPWVGSSSKGVLPRVIMLLAASERGKLREKMNVEQQ